MKTNLYKLEDLVKDVLERFEETRSDDFILIYRVYQTINEAAVIRELFCEVMLNHKKYGFPSFKTITRSRRKIFAKHPELNPKKIKELREKAEIEMFEYAVDGYNPKFMNFVDSQK